jgi:hypothetical protein
MLQKATCQPPTTKTWNLRTFILQVNLISCVIRCYESISCVLRNALRTCAFMPLSTTDSVFKIGTEIQRLGKALGIESKAKLDSVEMR